MMILCYNMLCHNVNYDSMYCVPLSCKDSFGARAAANPRAETLESQGSDSVGLRILRGGIPRSMGNFTRCSDSEILSLWILGMRTGRSASSSDVASESETFPLGAGEVTATIGEPRGPGLPEAGSLLTKTTNRLNVRTREHGS